MNKIRVGDFKIGEETKKPKKLLKNGKFQKQTKLWNFGNRIILIILQLFLQKLKRKK